MMKGNHRLLSAILGGLAFTLAPIAANAAEWNFGQSSASAIAPEPPAIVLAQSAQGVGERFNRVEAQMRTLTGQVEELTFQLRQLQDQLKRMQEDNEFRFRDLEGGTAMAPATPTPDEAPAANAAPPAPAAVPTLPPPGGPDAIGAIAEPPLSPAGTSDLSGPGAPPQSLGTLPVDAPPAPFPNQPIDLTAPLPPVGGAPPGPDVAMIAPTGDARTDYERAYASVLSGDYGTAEVAFRQFLSAYPDDALAPDAQYWLGESLFVRAQYRDAANEFLATYKAYPKSGKAPDALLKLGLSLAGLGEREAACRTFDAVLKQYPDASNALRQRVEFEQSSASC